MGLKEGVKKLKIIILFKIRTYIIKLYYVIYDIYIIFKILWYLVYRLIQVDTNPINRL